MQEVKSREDEYDEAESLQSRIRGLPDGFQLARRDRRLIAQGLVHQVHLRPKDRALLELDALVRVAAPRRKASDASLLSPIITSSSIPTPEGSRPHSEVSDSGSSGRSAGSRSFSDADASSGWISPPTPDSFTVPSHQGLNTSKPPGLDSSFSSSFHRLRTESLVSEFGEDPSLAAFESSSTTSRKVVKGKAKETPLYAFVFSDLVVLARKKEEGGRFKRSSTSSRKSEANYKVVETIGLSRVLGVSDLSGKTGASISLPRGIRSDQLGLRSARPLDRNPPPPPPKRRLPNLVLPLLFLPLHLYLPHPALPPPPGPTTPRARTLASGFRAFIPLRSPSPFLPQYSS